MKTKILIIEDEPAILLGLKDELSEEYITFTAANGVQGLELAGLEQPQLILLDLILPDLDGFEVCRKLKQQGIDASVIMLTARDQVVDKVKGLELGADDYITKPFSLQELKSRIKAVLRRRNLAPAEEYEDDTLQINFKSYQAKKGNKQLKLTPFEFKLLRFLVSKKGEVVTRDLLLEQVWGYDVAPQTRTVDAHILVLRKKIGKRYISTIHGEGYRFESS
ncbi:response regulator transcription factor [Candidatus Omnitrophota bacterium]